MLLTTRYFGLEVGNPQYPLSSSYNWQTPYTSVPPALTSPDYLDLQTAAGDPRNCPPASRVQVRECWISKPDSLVRDEDGRNGILWEAQRGGCKPGAYNEFQTVHRPNGEPLVQWSSVRCTVSFFCRDPPREFCIPSFKCSSRLHTPPVNRTDRFNTTTVLDLFPSPPKPGRSLSETVREMSALWHFEPHSVLLMSGFDRKSTELFLR